MLNITDHAARLRWQADMARQMALLEVGCARVVRPVLNRQFSNSAKLIEEGVLTGIDRAVDAETQFLISILMKQYRRTASVFGKKAFKIIDQNTKKEIKGPLDEFWSMLNNWMTTEAGIKITKIQKTTKRAIANIIQIGMNVGDSNRDIAKRLKEDGLILNSRRAVMIVRNETHTAANMSVDTAVRSTRLETTKEWVATKDERVRGRDPKDEFSHLKADGETVEMDALFRATGEELKYPGDPDGSPGNIILCRCVVIYHTKKKRS